MNAISIIERATAEGVRLALAPAGGVKLSGDQAAVNRWMAAIRDHKPEIVAALSDAANDPEPTYFSWQVSIPGGERLTVTYSPEATASQVRREYPGADIFPTVQELVTGSENAEGNQNDR